MHFWGISALVTDVNQFKSAMGNGRNYRSWFYDIELKCKVDKMHKKKEVNNFWLNLLLHYEANLHVKQ